MNFPKTARIPFDGKIDREGPPLIPHANAFPSAITSLRVLMGLPHNLELIGAHDMQWRADLDYRLYCALSGEGFRFFFDTAEYFRCSLPDGAVPVLDCLNEAGIPADLYSNHAVSGLKGGWGDEYRLRSLVCQNLSAGFPVLLLGRGETDRVLLATGYEDSGDTLVAWTFLPGADMTNKSFSPEDCQYLTNWTRGTDCAVLVTGNPVKPVDSPKIILRALARGARFLREQQSAPYGTPCNFYDSWLQILRENKPVDKPEMGIPGLYPEIWDLAERRAYLVGFFYHTANLFPDFDPEPPAKACDQIHSEMWRIHHLCEDKAQGGFKDPGVRKQIGEILESCRTLDLKTAGYLETFLQSHTC